MDSIWDFEKKSSECLNCGSNSVVRDYQRNITICADCGMILRENIVDRGPEWRAFSQEEYENKKRSGPPSTETIHDKGLSTLIDWRNRDSKGTILTPKRAREMYRLRKWNRRARISSSKDRNLTIALSEVNRMSSLLGLPRNTQEIASKIYRKAIDKDLIRGRSIEGVISAILYLACREANMPRTLEEVAEVSQIDKKELAKCYRIVTRKLNVHIPPTDSIRYIARFGSELELPGEVQTEPINLIKRVQKEKLTSGKSPSGTAAACIYIAALKSGFRKTQKEISEVANVTEVTIRNRYKEMAEKLGIELKP